MAQPILEKLSKAVSVEVGDEVSSYTADGNTVVALMREEAIAFAIGEVYDQHLTAMGIKPFVEAFPEYLGKQTISISAGITKIFNKASNVRRGIRGYLNASVPPGTGIVEDLTIDRYHEAVYDEDSEFAPTINSPKFMDEGRTYILEIGGASTVDTGTLEFLCLLQPVYTAFNGSGSDIVVPDQMWFNQIVQIASERIMSKLQE